MTSNIRILFVEDQEDDALLAIRQLAQGGLAAEFQRVDTTEALERALAEQTWDVLLVDWKLPGFDGWEALRLLQESGKDLPFIIFSGVIGEEAAVQAMKAGAHDFVSKGNPARLVPVVARELKEAASRHARRAAEADLRALGEDLERRVAERTALLEATNQELEAFSYSVSHDLQAPLRSVDGFSKILLEDYAGVLDPTGQDYLHRIRRATGRMAQLIDDLLMLSRFARVELHRERFDLGEMAWEIAKVLQETAPDRHVRWEIASDVQVHADPRLMRVAMENLLGNAWKFTGHAASPVIAVGREHDRDQPIYFVRDNGIGFDPGYVEKLFIPFSRLHTATEIEGTGIGLALVHRIIWRHGGRVWGEGAVGQGAVFKFTLG